MKTFCKDKITHRVRTIIPHLSYTELRKEKILPKKALFTGIARGGSLPSQAKKIGFSCFGMFLDFYIRKVLCGILNLDWKIDGQYIECVEDYDLYLYCMKRYFPGYAVIDEKDFSKNTKFYEEICEYVYENFVNIKQLQLEPEIIYENISGHPDLIIDGIIYDIKTTGQFGSMRTETIFQLLSYYCLAKLNNIKIHSIGLVLPAQRKVLKVDMTDWNWKPFWEKLKSSIDTKISLQPSKQEMKTYLNEIFDFVGSHIARESTLYRTFVNKDSTTPFQIFLAGRCSYQFKFSDADLAKTLSLTENSGHRIYVHSPYTFNLSKVYDEDNWLVEAIQKQLKATQSFGGKGVVIHCGCNAKKSGMDQRKAYTNMLENVEKACIVATSKCPLLIETSAGETGELLSNPEELITFYYDLSEKARKKVAICVDTCHVFSAGYIPMDFIEKLEEEKVPIRLIHYNDSKGGLGCKKDRHAQIGRGYVGLKELIRVGRYAIKNNIDMVYE